MTTINTEAFRRIEADETGFSVTCTSSDVTLEVALNADERRALAAALDPEREEIADQFDTFRAEIVAEAVKARESAVTRAAAFDAWLAKVKADAWDEGYKDCFLTLDGSGWRELEDNPYRKGGRL